MQAQITVKGQTLGDKLTPLGFTCTTPGVTGKRGFEVVPGQPVPTNHRLAFTPDRLRLPAVLRLDFEISAPGVVTVAKGLLVATLTKDRLSMQVTVPPLHRRSVLTGSVRMLSTARWSSRPPAGRR